MGYFSGSGDLASGFFATMFNNPDSKKKVVEDVFNTASQNYDKMNDITSLYLHRLWKADFANFISIKNNCKILDLASGSGDIAVLLLKKALKQNKLISVKLTDYNQNMLNLARQRLEGKEQFTKAIKGNLAYCKKNSNLYSDNLINKLHSNTEFCTLDACKMEGVEDLSFDAITCSFGIRNFYNIEEALKQIYNKLNHGGVFYCLEFSPPEDGCFKELYKIYSAKVMPFFAKKFASNPSDYDYLTNSIASFYKKDEFATKIKEAGFYVASHYSFLGGLVCVHYGKKCQN